MINYKAELNDRQYQAVTTTDGALLIIAGAGSGKTRVITFRIAYMLESGIPQHKILALTFTNKAATEMSVRVKELTQKKLQNLTVSTFHSFGVSILRQYIHVLGWRQNFSIYDEQDKIQLIRDSARELQMNPDDLEFYEIASLFSNIKIGRFTWENVGTQLKPLYEEYQRGLKTFNAVDFDDLIVLPIKILRDFPEIRQKYRERYSYIMIDEFQDTSLQQFEFMLLLADKNIAVVGDDDQSIYSWRGANYENIRMFERNFPNMTEIKLEQNYRSTETILAAANGVIAHNTNRKDKSLWSGNGSGKPIEIYIPENDAAEADFVVSSIRNIALTEHRHYDDFGILVRTNSLCRAVEEALLAHDVPYKISGGESFFKRKEIKDVISYLRTVANFDDDVNLIRIINTPRRGIGRKTLDDLSKIATTNNCSLWTAINGLLFFTKRNVSPGLFADATATVEDEYFLDEENAAKYSGIDVRGIHIPEKVLADLEEFVLLIVHWRRVLLREKPLSERIRRMVEAINYRDYLLQEFSKNEKAVLFKLKSLESLFASIENWERECEADGMKNSLYDYLNRITLFSKDDMDDEKILGSVNLMTIHASKGLEFPVVFIIGCEDGIIPHARSIEEGEGNIEEERRLFYVAITRAQDKLFISACHRRSRKQQEVECEVSPFLKEIPSHLVEFHDPEKAISDEQVAAALQALKSRFNDG
ncbi:MAG: exodeoxyribonuclease V subunit gamma [Spirochaetaceae bacterium]|nr:exodeoxyribonuclease V subunit gamma [Spirochaetaceae bacterium]